MHLEQYYKNQKKSRVKKLTKNDGFVKVVGGS